MSRKKSTSLVVSRPRALAAFGPHQSPVKYVLRLVPGGVDTFCSVLLLSPDTAMRDFAQKYAALTPADKKATRIEELAETLDLSVSALIGEFSRVAFETGTDLAKAMAGLASPQIMDASIALASEATADGTAERKMHFLANGFTPAPKGTTLINQQQTNVNAPAAPQGSGIADFDMVQRPVADHLRELAASPIDVEGTETDRV